jgi:hypothetical protein
MDKKFFDCLLNALGFAIFVAVVFFFVAFVLALVALGLLHLLTAGADLIPIAIFILGVAAVLFLATWLKSAINCYLDGGAGDVEDEPLHPLPGVVRPGRTNGVRRFLLSKTFQEVLPVIAVGVYVTVRFFMK